MHSLSQECKDFGKASFTPTLIENALLYLKILSKAQIEDGIKL